MREFLLIHGACHGAWCWQPLIGELEMRGARAFAIDLPGHGEDNTPRAGINRASYISAIIKHVNKLEASELTIVGHSLAGILLLELAKELPQRIRDLVFLAALVPHPGERVIDLIQQERRQSYYRQAEVSDDYTILRSFDKARDAYFGDLPEEQARLAYKKLTRQPFKVYLDPAPEVSVEVPIRYIVCKKDQSLPPERCIEWASRLGVTPEIINSDHDVMLSHPSMLAELLLNPSR
jgi:pimeloyl-ACP methyl ester carboxylesterase